MGLSGDDSFLVSKISGCGVRVIDGGHEGFVVSVGEVGWV